MPRLLEEFLGLLISPESKHRLTCSLLSLVAGLMVVFSFRGDLHIHEAEHACAELDGHFFHTSHHPSDHYGAHLPSITPLDLGLRHDHHLCSLCHLLNSGWLVTRDVLQVADILPEVDTPERVHWYGHDRWRVPARGPPIL